MKSLKDEILEDYINIDFCDDNPAEENMEETSDHKHATEPEHKLDTKEHLSALDGIIPLIENEGKIPVKSNNGQNRKIADVILLQTGFCQFQNINYHKHP